MKVIIDYLTGSRRGERFRGSDTERLRIGRHPESDVCFDTHRELDVSSRHAELRLVEGEYRLLDVGSSNGTFVDGEQIAERTLAPDEPVEVQLGKGGPRLRIWVGPDAVDPDLPPIDAGARRLGSMAEIARRASQPHSAPLKAAVFSRVFAVNLVTRSSWRLRVAILGTITVISIAALMLLR